MKTRINITLPQEILSLLDKVVEKGERSRLIEQAIKRYLSDISRANLKKLLKEGALKRSKRDLHLAKEWFSLEEEVWPKSKK